MGKWDHRRGETESLESLVPVTFPVLSCQCEYVVTFNRRHLGLAESYGMRVVTPREFGDNRKVIQSISFPNELVDQLQALAAQEQVSVAGVIQATLDEHFALRRSIAERAARSSREAFLEALDQIPDAEPAIEARLPDPIAD